MPLPAPAPSLDSDPRTVLTGVTVERDGGEVFVKDGGVVDIVPGSEMETAYGGAGNLSAVITGPSRSPEAALELSKEALAN
jgi:hypothetical protein